MTPEEVKRVVKQTINELFIKDLIRDNYQSELKAVNKKLYHHFERKKDKRITNILNELSDDAYIDIIYLQYRDKKTLEFIAEILDKDISTIKRNKQRLIKAIYKMLEE